MQHVRHLAVVTNPMAQAWLDARDDLGIRVVHPFEFETPSGRRATTVGVYLPDFGSPLGTLLLCRFDADELDELADETEYFSSGLSPDHYEPYNRERFIETLSDWGWYGPNEKTPSWYDPSWRDKLPEQDA
jgi:hypothetical protein